MSTQVDSRPVTMGRRIARLIVLSVSALCAQSAWAQSSMCTELVVETALPEVAPVIDVAAVIDVATTLIVDADLREAWMPDQLPDELPWCSSHNDPRCSKLPAGSVPTPAKAPAPGSTAFDPHAVQASAFWAEQPFGSRDGLGPCARTTDRLERPPRARGRTR